MEVHFTPDLEAKLTRLASDQGRNSEALVLEAVGRMVDYEGWFQRQVEEGLAAGARGELIEHEAIGRLIKSRYSG